MQTPPRSWFRSVARRIWRRYDPRAVATMPEEMGERFSRLEQAQTALQASAQARDADLDRAYPGHPHRLTVGPDQQHGGDGDDRDGHGAAGRRPRDPGEA